MRVELIYSPGCNTYKKALDVLETVIAEERLPIAIEKSEIDGAAPTIKINGADCGDHAHDQLRLILSTQWRELTLPAM